MKQFDLIVIGAGPGGYVAAIRAAQLGKKVGCIEKRETLGGTCLNVGCIPSKALLHSTELLMTCQKQGSAHGLVFDHLRVDFAQMMERKRGVVEGFTKGISSLFQKNKVEWIRGAARLISPHEVEVGSEKLRADAIILATGSEPTPLPFLPFDEKKILSSTGALALSSVPKKLLVIGAGVIGVEIGSVYKRLGSEVCCIEFLDRVCAGLDRSLSLGLQKSLSAQGIEFFLSHKVVKAGGTSLFLEGPEGEKKIEGDAVLVAIGRRAVTAGLGLENVGIEVDSKGKIPIDGSFRTKIPHIFAIGDLVEGPMLAHKASEEGVAVAELIAGKQGHIDYLSIPNVVYTHPEAASVGFTEEELKAKGIEIKVGQFPFKANSRARANGDDEGFVKVIAEMKSRKLLGVHILGPSASELIGEAVFAMARRATVDELAQTCHAHPTLSEAIKEGALSVASKPLHM